MEKIAILDKVNLILSDTQIRTKTDNELSNTFVSKILIKPNNNIKDYHNYLSKNNLVRSEPLKKVNKLGLQFI